MTDPPAYERCIAAERRRARKEGRKPPAACCGAAASGATNGAPRDDDVPRGGALVPRRRRRRGRSRWIPSACAATSKRYESCPSRPTARTGASCARRACTEADLLVRAELELMQLRLLAAAAGIGEARYRQGGEALSIAGTGAGTGQAAARALRAYGRSSRPVRRRTRSWTYCATSARATAGSPVRACLRRQGLRQNGVTAVSSGSSRTSRTGSRRWYAGRRRARAR